MANAATSVLGSVIGKLAAMLTEKYQLNKKVESGICFLRDQLSTTDIVSYPTISGFAWSSTS